MGGGWRHIVIYVDVRANPGRPCGQWTYLGVLRIFRFPGRVFGEPDAHLGVSWVLAWWLAPLGQLARSYDDSDRRGS